MEDTKKKKTSSTALPIGYVLKSDKFSYRIEKVLGQGGFGITYKVSTRIKHGNITLSAYFAVKEFFAKGSCWRAADGVTMAYNETMAEDVEESLHDFLSEGMRIARICKGNKNIVDVNEVFKANGTAYYVMEFISGGSLRDLVLKEGTLREEQALSYILPIAEALSYIHEEKLLHLDIKPENVMIRKGQDGQADEPVLIDFGVTIHFNDDGTPTSKHAMYTTNGYSPQEQYGGIKGFSPEADIYALSATLFYLLTGHDPISAFEMRPDYIKQNLPKSISDRTISAIMNGMNERADERTHSIKGFINSFSDNTFHVITDKELTNNFYKEDEPANTIEDEDNSWGFWGNKYVFVIAIVVAGLICKTCHDSSHNESGDLEEITVKKTVDGSINPDSSITEMEPSWSKSATNNTMERNAELKNKHEKRLDETREAKKKEEPVQTESEETTNASVPTTNSATESKTESEETPNTSVPTTYSATDSNVFEVVDVPPTFPSGNARNYVSSQIKYPAVAEENGVQGTVIVSFVIEKDGSISNVYVVEGADPHLDLEAVRAVKSMPKWIPGMKDGANVRVKLTMPIKFQLQ